MDIRKTISELHEERAKLDRVIASLEQFSNGEGQPQPQASRRGRRFMGAQERQLVSERMRKYWASRKSQSHQVMTSTASAA